MQKHKTARSKKYLKWIAGQDCRLMGRRGCQGEVTYHHVESGGTGMKGSDLVCIPLCYFHHVIERHGQGPKTFEDKYAIDERREAFWYLQRYVEEIGG